MHIEISFWEIYINILQMGSNHLKGMELSRLALWLDFDNFICDRRSGKSPNEPCPYPNISAQIYIVSVTGIQIHNSYIVNIFLYFMVHI